MARQANSEREQNGSGDARSVAEELQLESERLSRVWQQSSKHARRHWPRWKGTTRTSMISFTENFARNSGIKPDQQSDLDLEKLGARM